MELAFTEGLISTSQRSPTRALVTVYSEEDRRLSNDVAQQLRSAGLPTEVFYKAPKLGKQIEYAESKGVRYVLFIDAATREVKVKDLVTKEQTKIENLAEWARTIA